MYTTPGKPLNVRVQFKLGDDPASPSIAAYTVTDLDGEVVPSNPISIQEGATEAWITIPPNVHVLEEDEPYRMHRIEVSYTVNSLVFSENIVYYIIPDLFLGHTADEVRMIAGLRLDELPDSAIDFARSYIDLASGKYKDVFIAAINSDDLSLNLAAKQLVMYNAIRTLLPTIQLTLLKSIESETSKITRVANSSTLDALTQLVEDRFSLYLSMIDIAGPDSNSVFLVLSTPTDPVTGV